MTEPRALKVAIIGAGSVGLALADMLAASGDYAVLLADCVEDACIRAERRGLAAVHVDALRSADLRALIAGHDVVVAATPDPVTARIALAAVEAKIHYLDFASGVARASGARPRSCGPAFLDGCGVSPGLVDRAAAHLAGRFPGPVDLRVRVGAIPARRTNRLGYGLIWNLDGLLDEYTAPCEAIVDGQRTLLEPLSQKEEFSLGGVSYEAFCTAGGIGDLIDLAGTNVRNLVYRTIRYPGHLDYMRFLLDDLRLRDRRDLLTTILRNGLPEIADDMVLVYVTARGDRDGVAAEESLVLRIAAARDGETGMASALAVGSAAHAAALLDRIRDGAPDPAAGRGELERLLGNRFLKSVVACELLQP
jgi:saccharopine dehydrogenase-like NADP-dependent oxidoreductase